MLSTRSDSSAESARPLSRASMHSIHTLRLKHRLMQRLASRSSRHLPMPSRSRLLGTPTKPLANFAVDPGRRISVSSQVLTVIIPQPVTRRMSPKRQRGQWLPTNPQYRPGTLDYLDFDISFPRVTYLILRLNN
jgi:hypothetical protein